MYNSFMFTFLLLTSCLSNINRRLIFLLLLIILTLVQ